MSEMYVARRSMRYGRDAGAPIDRGQLIELSGLINDEKLVRLGYVVQASKGIAIVQCGVCAAKFTTDESLATHGRERHVSRSMTPEAEDKREAARQKLEDEVSPLDLTKTAASRGVSTHTGR